MPAESQPLYLMRVEGAVSPGDSAILFDEAILQPQYFMRRLETSSVELGLRLVITRTSLVLAYVMAAADRRGHTPQIVEVDMARFYFDFDDGYKQIFDDEGLELEDAVAARNEAMAVLPHIAKEVLPDGDRVTIVSRVRDGSGTVILRTTLSLVAQWMAPPEGEASHQTPTDAAGDDLTPGRYPVDRTFLHRLRC